MQRKGIGRRYAVTGTVTATPNGTTYIVLVRGICNKPAKILSIRICRTDATPADETLLIVRVIRGLSASVGTSFTPIPINSSDSASAFTAFVSATASNAGGTGMLEDAWNTRVPYDVQFAPDEAINIQSSNTNYMVRIDSTASVTVSLKFTIVLEEDN